MEWNDEQLAMYAKVTKGEIRGYNSPDEPEKKPKKLELVIIEEGDSKEAILCKQGTSNYAFPSGTEVYCTLTEYCARQASDAMKGIKKCTLQSKK